MSLHRRSWTVVFTVILPFSRAPDITPIFYNWSRFKCIRYTEIAPHGIESFTVFLSLFSSAISSSEYTWDISPDCSDHICHRHPWQWSLLLMYQSQLHRCSWLPCLTWNHWHISLRSAVRLHPEKLILSPETGSMIVCSASGIIVDISVFTPICSHQGTVIISLQADIGCFSWKRKSNRITGKDIKRINSQIILLKPDSLYIGTLFQAPSERPLSSSDLHIPRTPSFRPWLLWGPGTDWSQKRSVSSLRISSSSSPRTSTSGFTVAST